MNNVWRDANKTVPKECITVQVLTENDFIHKAYRVGPAWIMFGGPNIVRIYDVVKWRRI